MTDHPEPIWTFGGQWEELDECWIHHPAIKTFSTGGEHRHVLKVSKEATHDGKYEGRLSVEHYRGDNFIRIMRLDMWTYADDIETCKRELFKQWWNKYWEKAQ